MFRMRTQKWPVSPDQRVVLVAGGGGVLGRALIAKKPGNVFYANLSRRNCVKGEQVATFHADVAEDPERAFQSLSKLLPRVDVFAYAPYSHAFSSFKDMDVARALEEYKINVLGAARCTQLCARYFWRRQTRKENLEAARKSIWISSGAAFGKTSRPELATYGATKAALNLLAAYAHEYLFETYGVSVSVLAPGSLREQSTLEKTVGAFWVLQQARREGFLIEKIV